MSDEEEFEGWIKERHPAYSPNIKLKMKRAWLEKAKRDREKITEAVNDVLSYSLPYLAEKRLRELVEEMK